MKQAPLKARHGHVPRASEVLKNGKHATRSGPLSLKIQNCGRLACIYLAQSYTQDPLHLRSAPQPLKRLVKLGLAFLGRGFYRILQGVGYSFIHEIIVPLAWLLVLVFHVFVFIFMVYLLTAFIFLLLILFSCLFLLLNLFSFSFFCRFTLQRDPRTACGS